MGAKFVWVDSSLSALSHEIKSKVSQSEFNSLSGRVSTTESSITQLSGKVETTVTKVDGKNAVFKSYNAAEKPTVPYAKNDIWITFEGEMLQSAITRLSGVFVQSDWKPTTKYTDDSAANALTKGTRFYAGRFTYNHNTPHTINLGFDTKILFNDGQMWLLEISGFGFGTHQPFKMELMYYSGSGNFGNAGYRMRH